MRSATSEGASFCFNAANSSVSLTVKVEKQQVAVLAEYLARLLADLDPPEQVPHDMELDRRDRAAFRGRHPRRLL